MQVIPVLAALGEVQPDGCFCRGWRLGWRQADRFARIVGRVGVQIFGCDGGMSAYGENSGPLRPRRAADARCNAASTECPRPPLVRPDVRLLLDERRHSDYFRKMAADFPVYHGHTPRHARVEF